MTGATVEGFFDLTPESDTFILLTGLMEQSPLGIRALGGSDTVQGSTDSEIIAGNEGADVLLGGGGDDLLLGGQGADVVFGDLGNDFLNGNAGIDFVDGGDGNDILRGGRNEDVLAGGLGNDTLIGDLGANGIAGNAGEDLFVLRTDREALGEPDILLDFNRFEDRIGLTGGITEANLTFQEGVLPLSDLLAGFSELAPPEDFASVIQQTTGIVIDLDTNRVVSATAILQGEVTLAIAVNATEFDLRGAFVSISDAAIASPTLSETSNPVGIGIRALELGGSKETSRYETFSGFSSSSIDLDDDSSLDLFFPPIDLDDDFSLDLFFPPIDLDDDFSLDLFFPPIDLDIDFSSSLPFSPIDLDIDDESDDDDGFDDDDESDDQVVRFFNFPSILRNFLDTNQDFLAPLNRVLISNPELEIVDSPPAFQIRPQSIA